MLRLLALISVLAAAAALPTQASAQSSRGVSDYDFRSDSNVRRDTRCLLKIDGDEIHNSYCDVYRQDGGRVSIVDIGARKFKIVRDSYDNGTGSFQTINNRVIDESIVAAPGGCWRGDRVRFCAK